MRTLILLLKLFAILLILATPLPPAPGQAQNESPEKLVADAIRAIGDSNQDTWSRATETKEALLNAPDDPPGFFQTSEVHAAGSAPPPARDTSPDEDVRSAMEDLKSRDPFTRYAAALILKKKGAQAQPAVPLLRRLAQDDPDPGVRQAADEAVRRIQPGALEQRDVAGGTPVAQEPELARVIALLQDQDAERRKLAARYLRNLGRRGTQAVTALIQTLDDTDTNVRMAAISALGRMLPESKKAFPKIAQIAMQKNAPAEMVPEVLLAALTAEAMQSAPPDLAPEKGERAVLDYALKQLHHEEASRRWMAATALPFLGGPADEILPILENLARNDPEESVRSIAALGIEAARREQHSGAGDQALGSTLGQEPAPLTREGGIGTPASDVHQQAATSAAACPGGSVPRSQEAVALARDVTQRINEAYYSLLATPLRGFQAEFMVEQDGRTAGRMTVTWDRAQPRLLSRFSEDMEKRFQNWLANSLEYGMRSTLLSWRSPETPHPIYALRTGKGYILDASTDPALTCRVMDVSEDFRQLHDLQRYEDGLELQTEFQVLHAEDKHFAKSLTRTARKPGTQEMRNVLIFTYTHREDLIFLKRLVIEDFTPTGKTVWKLELESVEFGR